MQDDYKALDFRAVAVVDDWINGLMSFG